MTVSNLEGPRIEKLTSSYLNSFRRRSSDVDTKSLVHEITSDLMLLLQLYRLGIERFRIKQLIFLLVKDLAVVKDKLGNNYCVFFGRLRVFLVLIKIYTEFDDKKLLKVAESFLEGSIEDYLNSPFNGNGLVNGKAGLITALSEVCTLGNLDRESILKVCIDRFLSGIAPYKTGIINLNNLSDLAPSNSLAQGAASVVWLLSSIQRSGNTLDSTLRLILDKAVLYTNSTFNSEIGSWSLLEKDLNSYKEHLSALRGSGLTNKKLSNNFWEGSSGIMVALLNYLLLDGVNQVVRIQVTKNIEKAERILWKNLKNKYEHRYLFYTYLMLYKVLQKQVYLERADKIFHDCENRREKLIIALTIYRNGDTSILDIIPEFSNRIEWVSQPQFEKLSQSFFYQSYPKTSQLLVALRKSIISDLDNPIILMGDFHFNLEKLLEGKIKRIRNRRLTECFQFEKFRRKFLNGMVNKFQLKLNEIKECRLADEMLRLEPEQFGKRIMVISPTIDAFKTKWDWSQGRIEEIVNNLKVKGESQVLIVQARATNRGYTEISLTLEEYILLCTFKRPIKIAAAIRSFKKNFTMNTPSDELSFNEYCQSTLTELIFSRLLIPS